MSFLAPAEYLKYDTRAKTFVDKLQAGGVFQTKYGYDVLIETKEVVDALLSNDRDVLVGLRLPSESGTEYRLSDFVKTKEFGGGSPTQKEEIALKSLQAQIEEAKGGRESIKFSVGNMTYNISGAESTPGTPKSDFHLLDVEGNEVVWISHKDGSTAKDFQQWGGMTSREYEISIHPETVNFVNSIRSKYDVTMPRATTVARKITDARIKMIAVYGNQYGSDFGPQNVQLVAQGSLHLTTYGSSYRLEANHIHLNGESFDGTEFEPVFMGIYKGDRSNYGITGLRVGISPIGSRKIHHFI